MDGKVWYRIVGEGKKTPLLLLHGGPGVPSYYLNPLSELGKDRPVIFFDQIGCGRSDRISDTSLMTVENFVEDLRQVRDGLGLKDYYLFEHSWGTMLGTDFYLKYPEGIKGIIVGSPSISIKKWMEDAASLISTLPDSIQNAIRSNEANKTYKNPDYQQALIVYYQNFVARKLPWSSDVDSAFGQMGANVYEYMGGPSEFTMTGPLLDYDRSNRLAEIKVPVLVMGGEFDEVTKSSLEYYHSLIPGSKLEIVSGAGHLSMQDNPQQHNQIVKEFLDGLDGK